MKYSMNMLLWTTDCTEEHFPMFDKLKAMGYDGVELPVFDMQLDRFQQVGKKLDSLGLERTAVTVCTDAENPIASDKAFATPVWSGSRRRSTCAPRPAPRIFADRFTPRSAVFRVKAPQQTNGSGAKKRCPKRATMPSRTTSRSSSNI